MRIRSDFIVRALIRLYPADFRERYGRALLEFHQERASIGLSLVDWARVVADHLGSATIEWVRLFRPASNRQQAFFDGEKRTMKRSRWFDLLVQDLRYAWRTLRRAPVFTLVASLSLAFGIGANTAIFGVIHAVLLAPIGVPAPEQLAVLRRSDAQTGNNTFAYDEFRALQGAVSQARVSAFGGAGFITIGVGDQREFINADQVDGAFFDMLGVSPLRGRLITTADEASAAPVAVISEPIWERYFNREASAIGQSILLNGAPFVVVGITPARYQGLYFPGSFQVAVPMSAAELLAEASSRTR